MTPRFMHGLMTLFLLALVAGGLWYLNRPQAIEVVVRAVETGTDESSVSNTRAGTVKACRRARLSPGIGGQIGALEVTEGEHVKAGQLLLALWNRDLTAEIALNQAESAAALATTRSACLQAQVARREADRLAKLRHRGAVSEENIDKAETEARALQAGCESANAMDRVAAARVDVVGARMERTRLTAPFDGVVAEVNGELNEYVTPSPPPRHRHPAGGGSDRQHLLLHDRPHR